MRAELAGARSTPVTLFGRTVGMAPGAPALAWMTGSALLPVFCRRRGFFDYEIVVEPPLPPADGSSYGDYVARSTELLGARIEEWVRRAPADWQAWDFESQFWRAGESGGAE